jgi:hypothetical protein
VRRARDVKIGSDLGLEQFQAQPIWEMSVETDLLRAMEEYESYIEEWRDSPGMVAEYRGMRNGVVWLTSNREMISSLVDEWRLLFRLDSNCEMDLSINDSDPLYVFIRHEDLANRNYPTLRVKLRKAEQQLTQNLRNVLSLLSNVLRFHRSRAFTTQRYSTHDTSFAPSQAWEGRIRCKEANMKPFNGILRVGSPSGRA